MVRPKFVVLENVAAILNNGLDIVLGELSQAGYDAEWSVISASSLGACHRRSRWWCVAYTKSKRTREHQCGLRRQFERGDLQTDRSCNKEISFTSHSNRERLQRQVFSQMEREIWAESYTRRLNPNWRQYVSKPILPRGSDGLSFRVDRTKALGNSVVPQVAAIPLQRVHDIYFNEKR